VQRQGDITRDFLTDHGMRSLRRLLWLQLLCKRTAAFPGNPKRGGFSDHRTTLLFSKEIKIASGAERNPASSRSEETWRSRRSAAAAQHLRRSRMQRDKHRNMGGQRLCFCRDILHALTVPEQNMGSCTASTRACTQAGTEL